MSSSISELLCRYKSKVKHFGLNRFCPVCNSHVRKFFTYGLKNRLEAQCPVCGSLERHRAIWLFLKEKTNLKDGKPKKLMHIAPEKELERLFRNSNGIDYISVDLNNPDAMVKADITDIPYDEGQFDIVYCSHVLEHIPDDRKAISEFYRILKTGGWALISVPLTGEKTSEDLTITDPREREKLYGQDDHVRQYGMDVAERFRSAGFDLEIITPSSYMSDKDISRCAIGVETNVPLFYCKKN